KISAQVEARGSVPASRLIGPTRVRWREIARQAHGRISRHPVSATSAFRPAKPATLVSYRRTGATARAEASGSAQEISLDAHAFQNIGVDGNDFLPARVLGVGHLHR